MPHFVVTALLSIPLALLCNSKQQPRFIMTLALLCRSWFIENLQVRTLCDAVTCKKLTHAEHFLLWGRPMTLTDSPVVLDSSNFHLKWTSPWIVGREMGCNWKNSFSRKVTLSGKLNVKMTPPWVFRVFRTERYYRLYRLIEKTDFCWYLTFVFMMYEFLGRIILLCEFPPNLSDYNNMLITMKKDAALNLSTFQ